MKNRRILYVIVAIALGAIAAITALRHTPHGWLTWQTALVLRLNDLLFPANDWPATDAASLKALREGMHSVLPMIARERPDSVRSRDLEIPGPGGPIPIRIYERIDRVKGQALLVYYHGGGHVVGDISSHDHVCAELAARGLIVVNVDYRLAPEHPYPAAVEDAIAAFEWSGKNATELGSARDRVFVGGDSAGGNLAAAVALAARDKGINLRGQVLIYPATDISRLDTDSYEKFSSGYLLTRRKVDWYRTQYTPQPTMRLESLASPLRARSHQNLAPALIITAEFDVLRDDGFLYAQKLKKAGTPTKYLEVPGVIHGFLNIHRVAPEGLAAIDAIAAWIQTQQSQGPQD